MEKEDLFDALDEYYERKRKKELKDSAAWRVAERFVIFLFLICPAVCLLIKAPFFEIGESHFNVVEATSMAYEYRQAAYDQLENGTTAERELHVLTVYYSNAAGYSAICLAVLTGLIILMISVRFHTRKEAVEVIGLIVGIDSLLLAVLTFFKR